MRKKPLFACLPCLCLLSSAAPAEPRVGCVLYSLGRELAALYRGELAAGQSEEEARYAALRAVLADLAEMGYAGVQFLYDEALTEQPIAYQLTCINALPPEQVAALLKEFSLIPLAPHCAQFTREACELLAALGCEGLTLQGCSLSQGPLQALPEREAAARADAEYYRDALQALSDWGYGDSLYLSYHSHWWELPPVNAAGENDLDFLWTATEGRLALQLDTAWACWPYLGPEGLAEYLQTHAHQFTTLLHVKDIEFATGTPCAVGRGDIPWEELLPLWRENGVEWLIVENDGPRKVNGSGLEDMAENLRYLQEKLAKTAN